MSALCQKQTSAPPHSITSSARASSDCGTVSPSAFGATAALVYLLVLLSRTVFRKLRMYSHGVVRPKP
jgi:hypothetical protein